VLFSWEQGGGIVFLIRLHFQQKGFWPRLGCVLRRWVGFVLCAPLAATYAFSQSVPAPSNPPAASVQDVQFIKDKSGIAAVQIVATRRLEPAIQTLTNPARLVIDLPANMAVKRKRIAVGNNEIRAIRVDQYQNVPPVTRVVVDLIAPRSYTWEVNENHIIVHLKAAEDPNAAKHAAAEPPAEPTLSVGRRPAVVPMVAGGGNVVFAGSKISTGSSFTAGADTAILHIERGGEVRVCPGSTVSLTTSANGQDLMLGMSTGAMETHYTLGTSADSILTPDFRILLAGPGEFDFAISADSRGNTCVRALMGNTASAIVSELLGDRTYQVKPSEQAMFAQGRIDKVSREVPLECGCPPPPSQPLMRASQKPDIQERDQPANVNLADANTVSPSRKDLPNSEEAPVAIIGPSHGSESRPLPPAKPGEIHVQVEAPIVYRATDTTPGIEARLLAQARAINLYPRDFQYATPVLPPPAPQELAQGLPSSEPVASSASPQRGVFGHIKGFFAAIFR
jgi:hypothetical protein